jgi:hypothetical protein
MMRPSQQRHSAGFVLIAVVVVLAMLSLSAYTFTHWVSLELEVVDLEGKRLQARHLAESGKSLVEAIAIAKQRGLPAPPLTDNPELFEGIVIEAPEDPAATQNSTLASEEPAYARFSVYSEAAQGEDRLAGLSDTELVRFGVEHEGGKIHLNEWMARNPVALGQALLLLPNATSELIDAVLDWMDEDDQKRTAGAETAEYEALQPPIGCRNGPLESLDELLLVKGMTREILYGEDTNHNGQLDANEDDGDVSPPFDDQDGELSRGWWPYLTLFSREANVDAFGRRRIFLNDPDLGRLYGEVLGAFDEEVARLVVAFRLFGAGGVADPAGPASLAKYSFLSPLQLIDLSVSGTWDGQTVRFESPFRSNDAASLERFATVYDRLTVRTEPEFIGRLDLGTAAPAALALLTSLTEDKRTAIQERRPSPMAAGDTTSTDPNRDASVPEVSANETLIWLLRDGVLTPSELMGIEHAVTMRSPVLRFQSAGFFDDAQFASRIEVVLDTDQVPPRVLAERNLDRYGPGVPLLLLGQLGERKELPALSDDSNQP